MNGEDPPERPDYITNIINGLERYNPEAVGALETYLQEQCEQKFCDSNANRTLLKLWVDPLSLFLLRCRKHTFSLLVLESFCIFCATSSGNFSDDFMSTFPIT